ncbi:nuclear transport factor 2 family protein [Aliirhizobium smilacinae]|uniref:Nuclear transport factor 2 family protein n=1 Tax=Aliirhizobium smilacinae TaxID=1395944 RepID=A0A5C4XEE2_9HYPH|nr:nuclear transport factor 2 family protein [Rhizobium smilacinae]TNM61865.1 nuclear transport factor 2 family protein [Rhizobium smilacinae]
MPVLYQKLFAADAMRAAFAIATAGGLIFAADQAQAVDCVNKPSQGWVETANDPPAADERAIIKLIHLYNWALDKHDSAMLVDLFSSSVFYELCNAAGEQLTQKNGEGQLQGYLNDYFDEFDVYKSQPRHIESNTLLHAVDANTVQGKTTVVVTLQHSDIETPVLDYTGVLRTEFEKLANVWRFSKMTLIVDGPQLTLRAR